MSRLRKGCRDGFLSEERNANGNDISYSTYYTEGNGIDYDSLLLMQAFHGEREGLEPNDPYEPDDFNYDKDIVIE